MTVTRTGYGQASGSGSTGPTNALGNSSLLGANRQLYVSTSGDDSTGDGSSGNPFATIQRALDEVPDGFNNWLQVNVASGTYAPAVLNRGLGTDAIVIVAGDTTSPVLTLPALASWATIGNQTAHFRHTSVGAHGGFAGNTHWVQQNFGDIDFGYAVLGSASDQLDMPSDSAPFSLTAVHAFSTTVNFSPGQWLGSYRRDSQPMTQFYVVGLEFTGTVRVINVEVYGCNLSGSNNTLYKCNVNSAHIETLTQLFDESSLLKASVDNQVTIEQSQGTTLQGCVFTVGSVLTDKSPASFLNKIDFEGTGTTCINITAAGETTVGEMWIDSVRTDGVLVFGGKVINQGSIATGSSVTGDILRLADGAQFIGASTWTTNVTGENMKIGDNASALISGITFPSNDGGATNPHFCRAT